MKKTLLRRFIAFSLALSLIIVYPLECCALGLYGTFTDIYDNVIDYLTFLEEKSAEIVKTSYDLTFGNNNFPDWLDGFHKIDTSQWGNPSNQGSGSPGSGGSGGCNFIYVSYDKDYYFCDHAPDLNCALSLSNLLYPNSAGKIVVTLPDFPYYTIINFSKSPESDNCHVYSRIQNGLLNLYLNGSYNGDVSFTSVYTSSYKGVGFVNNPFPQYQDYYVHWFDANYTVSLGSVDMYKIIRNFSGSSDRYLAYTDFPLYDYYTGDLVSEGQPTLDFESSYMMHPASKWSGSTDKYIVDAMLWYTGDPEAFDPDDYTASAGLVYVDDQTGNTYLPSEYVFFDRLGGGKVDTMSAPACVFHFHLDKIKDWIIKKQLGTGNFYIFIGCFDNNNDAVYYRQYALDVSMVDDSLFSGVTDYPDWDDYKPDTEDESVTPTITINNYNDYETFESTPNTFDFDAYAQWMYTNLGIMNDNIGILNDNLVSFFDAFQDFIDDFYPFFTKKFKYLVDSIDDNCDALAKYIKDINMTSTFNGNVIVSNLADELKDLFVPEPDDLSLLFEYFCPWFKQVMDAFGVFVSPTPANLQTAASLNRAPSLSGSAPELDDCVFSFSLPDVISENGSFSLGWKSYNVDLDDYKDNDLYTVLVYVLDAAGFFTCVRIAFSIFGLSIGESTIVEPEPEHKKIGF